jgi:hypothetical protein
MTPGTRLQSPEGRHWVVGIQTGFNALPTKDHAIQLCQRADRRKGEVLSLWFPESILATWEVLP